MRTCPALFEGAGWQARHWFDGLCMIYAFRIGERGVGFQSRLLESEAAREIETGPSQLGSFGTPTGRSLLRRVFQPIQRITDNTNVNLVQMGPDLVALTEGDRQQRIEPVSLRSLGSVSYEPDPLGRGAVMSAHPHYDFERGQVVNFATKFGANGVVSVYHHEGAARSRQVVGSWRTGRVPYLHSFGLTPDRAILVGHPFTARPLDMLWSNRGFIDHFEWRPSDGTRLVVIDRGTGAVSEFETDAMFVFHTVNAFTRGAETFLDVLAYPDADIMDELRVQRMITALPDLRPKLVRLRMHHGKRTVTPEPLADIGFEFPSINYRAVNGRAHRFVWGAANGPQPDGAYASSIVKVDLQGGVSSAYTDGERIFGEPVFVADPNGTDEDAGVLLSVGTSKQGESSALVVIDAKSMERVAMATVSHSIPLGFHGSFIREHAQGDA